jgi:eukaryotic-like serine/threonine-protein kinase
MAADPDRPLADDTVLVDADALAANEQEEDWPVDDHYLVRPESEAGGVPVHPTVESAPSVPRRFPPDLGPGLLLAIAGMLGAVLIGALLVAARNDGGRPASVTPSAEQETPATMGPDLQTPTTSTSPETAPSDQKATTKPEASVVEVPRVVGLTASSAVADLRDAGLVTKIRLVTSSKRPGLVLRQSPTDAGRVEKGATVRLDVSRARPVATKIEVPSVVGDTVADARQQLQGLGLSVLITKVASDQPLGTVLRQSPHAGAEVGEDERVTLTVSAGQQTIDVPDVTGLDEDSAREQLETAGFQVEATDEPTSDPTQDGLVLRQSPAGTTALPKGGVVSIVVARLG